MSENPNLEKFNPTLAGEWSLHFEQSIKNESARAKVILSSCYLEELCKQLIKILLIPSKNNHDPLFDGPISPLGSFSAKIEMLFRMGVINEDVAKSLHLVRKIRNVFAHDFSQIDFSDPKILCWNNELHLLNDYATEETRASFSEGAIGDFEKSVSWLIYWLKYKILNVPSECPNCGKEMEYRSEIKNLEP